MAYSVRISQPAQDEYAGAISYITRNLASPQAARALADAFDRTLEMLSAFPFAYPIDEPCSNALGTEIRRARVKNYKVMYRIAEESETVEIISFLHSRQDAPRHIGKDAGRRPKNPRPA